MNLTLAVFASLVALARGNRYGLLRVGSPASGSGPAMVPAQSRQHRLLFEEDFSLAFRQLFGYKADLCMSMMAAPLSMSMMEQAQLSMSLAPLSLSLGAGMMSFSNLGEGTLGVSGTGAASRIQATGTHPGTSSQAGTSSGHVSDTSVKKEPPIGTSKSNGAEGAVGAAALIVGAVAAVGVASVVTAKNRLNVVSSASPATDV